MRQQRGHANCGPSQSAFQARVRLESSTLPPHHGRRCCLWTTVFRSPPERVQAGKDTNMKTDAVALILASLSLGACAGTSPSRLEQLRVRPPAALVDVDARYQEVSSCLSERVRHRNNQVVQNLRPSQHRSTITGYSIGRGRRAKALLRFEYEVVETGPTTSRVSLRRPAPTFEGDAASDLQSTLRTCGFAARITVAGSLG